jgi:chromosome partitioning protein
MLNEGLKGYYGLSNVIKNESMKDYDFVLIDCPPSVDAAMKMVMAATNEIVRCLVPEANPLQGMKSIDSLIDEMSPINSDIETTGVIVSKVQNNNLHKSEIDSIQSYCDENGYKVLPIVKNRVVIAQANTESIDILTHAGSSDSAEVYREIAKKL